MKVLHVVNSLAIGGAEKLLLDALPIYKKQGVEVELLTLQHLETFLYDGLVKSGITINTLSLNTVYNPIGIFKLFPYLRRFDIIHVHLFPAQYWISFAKFLTFSKAKLVFTEHNTTNRRRGNMVFRIFDWMSYLNYSFVGCITTEVKDELIKHLPSLLNKTDVINNGINLMQYHNVSKLKRRDIHPTLNETDKLIIQVSAFRKQKDQDTAIKALQYLPFSFKLLLVGDGERKKACENLSEKLCLNERVIFLGKRSDVAILLKSTDITVLSSHWEGFGLVAVESMALGIPVIGSNVLGLSNIISDDKLLFEKGNEKELAEKISLILNDDILYDTLSKKCSLRASLYDINNMVSQYIIKYRGFM